MTLDTLTLEQLKHFDSHQLTHLADTVRQQITNTCSQTGGHLAGNLGAVELTIALHYVFDSPADQLVFDVGHQSYTHKLLTGRASSFATLRQKHGLSGFTDPHESVHDANITGHAGNAISVATGLSIADPTHTKIAIVGDGCLLNGMSVEALNHLSTTTQDVLIIINDNQYSIDPCTGQIAASGAYRELCESFGLPYTGPLDGHNFRSLISTLQQLRSFPRPRVLHVRTQKGRGVDFAQAAPDKTHFYQQVKPSSNHLKLQDLVGQTLLDLAVHHPHLDVITPAMSSGGGLSPFAHQYPDRFYDVGIAESHAVGLAAGLAQQGHHPFVHLYASFLQRALDQIIHDVALADLPVTFLVDRAGLVGADGATHQGTLAFNLLQPIPNLTLYAPGDAVTLVTALHQAARSQHPVAILYPKVTITTPTKTLTPKPSLLRPPSLHDDSPASIALLTTGWLQSLTPSLSPDIHYHHYHLTTLKPLSTSFIHRLASRYRHLIVAEENMTLGGVGQTIAAACSDLPTTVITQAIPDHFITHATREQQLTACGLDAAHLARLITKLAHQN